jgi:putative hydrolase of the HAD superfamily
VLPEPRAVVFDIDDTLYPYRRFALSGFRAVAGFLATHHGVDRRRAFRVLRTSMRDGNRGRELQACLAELALPDSLLRPLLHVFEHHDPDIRLPRAACRTLETLRREGWKLGVLTNGPAARQARRARALDLHRLTDAVLYAECHGDLGGKPDPEAFRAVVRALDTPAEHVVFVGDDEVCDVQGSARAGMQSLRAAVWRPVKGPTVARAVLQRLCDLPGLAADLLDDGVGHHAIA